MSGHALFLAQTGQQRTVGGELSLCGQQLRARRRAVIERGLYERRVALVVGNDALYDLDLGARRGGSQRLRRNIGRQRQIGGIQLVPLVFGVRGLLLECTPRAAKRSSGALTVGPTV